MQKLHLWHRYIGISVSVLVIILSITGLLLNFSDSLKLNRSYVGTSWLLKHYNIGNFPVVSFKTNHQIVSQASGFVYLDGNYVLNLSESLVGVINLTPNLLLATDSSLLLVDSDGQLIDEIGKYSGLPESPLGISITAQGHPVIRGVNTYWKGSETLSAWQPLEGPHPKWIAPVDTPKTINSNIQNHARSHEIHLERVMLDLHSGRLFGSWGQNIMSIAAALFIILAATGLVIWLRKKPS